MKKSGIQIFDYFHFHNLLKYSTNRNAIFYFIFLFLLFLTNISIIYEIPICQPLFFLFFVFILGFLFLNIIHWEGDLLSTLLHSIAIGLFFLMLGGIFVNFIFPIFNVFTPISKEYLLLFFDGLFLLLTFLAFKFGKLNLFTLKDVKLEGGLTLISLLLILNLILLPILGISGVILLNNNISNIINIIIYLDIIFLVILVYFKGDKIPYLYPLGLYSISITLILLFTLRSNFIMGSDIHSEFECVSSVLKNQYWDLKNPNMVNTVASITLLEPIVIALSGIKQTFLFKLVIPFVFSLTSIAMYQCYNKLIKSNLAFLSVFLLIFQVTFWQLLPQMTRMMICLFYISMVFSIMNRNNQKFSDRFLLILYIVSMTMSHYTTVLIFLIIFGLSLLAKYLRYVYIRNIKITQGTLTMNLFFLLTTVYFLWYAFIVEGGIFNMMIKGLEKVISNFIELNFKSELGSAGISFAAENLLPYYIWKGCMLVIYGIIGIGSLYILKNYLQYKDIVFEKKTIPSDYAILSISTFIMFIVIMIVPAHLTVNRQSILLALILSYLFPIGIFALRDTFSRLYTRPYAVSSTKKIYTPAIIIIIMILIVGYASNVGLVHQACGVPRFVTLNNDGESYKFYYFHQKDLYSAKWLTKRLSGSEIVYVGGSGGYWLTSHSDIAEKALPFINDNRKGIFYFTTNNMKYNEYRVGKSFYTIPNNFFDDGNLIYSNGGSIIVKNM